MKTLPFITSGISMIIFILSPFILSEEGINKPLMQEDSSLDISLYDDAKWSIERMDLKNTYKLDYINGDVSVIVDMDESSDANGVGISFIINGNLYTAPSKHLISPLYFDQDHSELEIQVKGEEIRIYYKGGTLGDLVQIDYDKSLKMHASIEIVDQKLNVEMVGLYNIASGLSVDHITCNHAEGISSFRKDDDRMLKNVEFLLINTDFSTPIHLSTRATVIGLTPDKDSGINLSFGEAYSMGGQESVASTLIIDEEINTFKSFFNPLNN